MDYEVGKKVDEALLSKLDELSSLPEDQRKGVVDQIATLYRVRSEDQKNQAEAEKSEIHYQEEMIFKRNQLNFQETQLKSQEKDRWIGHGLAIAGIVLPLISYAVMFGKGLKFEETGSVNSPFVKNLLNLFRPKGR